MANVFRSDQALIIELNANNLHKSINFMEMFDISTQFGIFVSGDGVLVLNLFLLSGQTFLC